MRSSMPNFPKSCLDLGDFGVAGSPMPGRIMPNLQSLLAVVLEPTSVSCSLSSIPKGPNMT